MAIAISFFHVSQHGIGREVVRGDIIVLAEGDRVPADGVLRRGINLSIDESLLTGECVPVRKVPSIEARVLNRSGGDDLLSIFSGTLVTAGQGVAEILSTASHSELGKIGTALQKVEPEATLLQKETGRLVRTFAIAGLLACAFVVVTFALTREGEEHSPAAGCDRAARRGPGGPLTDGTDVALGGSTRWVLTNRCPSAKILCLLRCRRKEWFHDPDRHVQQERRRAPRGAPESRRNAPVRRARHPGSIRQDEGEGGRLRG